MFFGMDCLLSPITHKYRESKKMTKDLKYWGITKTLYDKYQEVARETGTDKNFMNNLYSYIGEQLFYVGNYTEEQIKHFFHFTYDKLHPNYYKDETDYTQYNSINEYTQHLFNNMSRNQEEQIQENRELMELLMEFQNRVNKELLHPNNVEQINTKEMVKNTPKARITELLNKFNKGQIKSTQKEQLTIELVDLLEQEEQLFMVDFPDETKTDGYKSKYYHINPDTNSHERTTKTTLKDLFNEKYGVKLHKGNKFYYNLLERIYNHREEQPHIVEMENVYIDTRNYNIITKGEHDNIFTTNRLTYTTYQKNELRLFKYQRGIRLDNLKEFGGDVEMSFPMKRIYEMFVPKLKPEETTKLRMFMQYMGLMVMGNNPTKLLLMLYDLENKDTGSKGRSTLFQILQLCFQDTFVRVGKNVFRDNFQIETYAHGKHGVYMDETDKDVFIKHHTEIKELVNGSGTSGGAMYTREQIKINSLPFLMGTNGLPDPPLFDTALLQRLVPIELPNKFVDTKDVTTDTNTYKKITNLENMIRQHIEGLSQVISIAINEFKTFDLTESLDGQFAIPPNIDRTIQILSQTNIVLGLLQTYTKPVARGTNKRDDWITTDEIIPTISQAYKRATNKEIDPEEVKPARIGTLLKQLYPNFIGREENKTTINGKAYYNLTLRTYDEVMNAQNEIISVLPLGEHDKIYGLEKTIYKKIQQGVNTIKKLYEELEVENEQIDETLEQLHLNGLIERTQTQRLDID